MLFACSANPKKVPGFFYWHFLQLSTKLYCWNLNCKMVLQNMTSHSKGLGGAYNEGNQHLKTCVTSFMDNPESRLKKLSKKCQSICRPGGSLFWHQANFRWFRLIQFLQTKVLMYSGRMIQESNSLWIRIRP